MKESAATALVTLARQQYRLVTDETTGRVYAVPQQGEGEPIWLPFLGDVLALAYFEHEHKVASAAAKKDALAVLQAMPVVETAEIVKPPPPPDPEEVARQLSELEAACAGLRAEDDLLGALDGDLHEEGFRGDTAPVQLIYLALLSTLLEVGRQEVAERLASAKVAGATSTGKNYAADAALGFLPEDLPIRVTGASDRALIYDTQSYERRVLYYPEGAAIRDDGIGALMLRSLLSEGRICYPVVVTQEGGLPETVLVVKEGPTLALICTSAVRLDRDLESRVFQVTIDDSEQVTGQIIGGHGERAELGGREPRDRSEWHAYYSWLRLHGPFRVRVPFGRALAEKIPPRAVRLRRDVGLLFTLIATHAVLNLPRRERDDSGRLIATINDYQAVHRLADQVLAQGVAATVPPWARETWEAIPDDTDFEIGVTYAGLGRKLGIGVDAARDRALKLSRSGYVVNKETRRYQAARLVRGDELPEGEVFLPSPETLNSEGGSEPDPNTRTAPGNRMDTGVDVRAPQPEPQPEPERQESDAHEHVRGSGSASDTPTRTANADGYAENKGRSGVRGGSEPPTETVFCEKHAKETRISNRAAGIVYLACGCRRRPEGVEA